MFQTISIFIVILTICAGQNEESKVVIISQGPVRGYKAASSEVFEFLGIPYATAPTGVDKFKAPLAAPVWTETFEAVRNNIGCPMNPLLALSSNTLATEDCLVANVFTPNTVETNLPVVVYIHGGAYIAGTGLEGTPKPLVESQKLVAVNFNYRLGVHGFLCLGTEDIPGNAGLKDMLALLRWVKENIESFGGNPDDVTLAGYSAGASAADLLSLSKAAEGLFQKLILDSGSHVAAFSVQLDPIKTAQNYAENLNFSNVRDINALEEFYKTLSYDLLLSDLSSLSSTELNTYFCPCIENDLGQERILDDSPVNLLQRGEFTPLPSLYGFANMEGLFRLPFFDAWAPQMNENFSHFLETYLEFDNDEEKETITQTIKQFYFGNSNVGLYTVFNYIDYFTDVLFAYPTLRSVKLQAEAGNDRIYLYEYQFYKKFPAVPGVPDILINFPGAGHCDQTFAVLEMRTEATLVTPYTEEYTQLRAQMRELWINYITTGAPVPPGDTTFPIWPPTNASRSPHMILGDTIELGDALNENRARFWDDIYDRYYRYPKPPIFVENVETEDQPPIFVEPEEDETNHAVIKSLNIILSIALILIINVINHDL